MLQPSVSFIEALMRVDKLRVFFTYVLKKILNLLL
jgi:hypothetical protein